MNSYDRDFELQGTNSYQTSLMELVRFQIKTSHLISNKDKILEEKITDFFTQLGSAINRLSRALLDQHKNTLDNALRKLVEILILFQKYEKISLKTATEETLDKIWRRYQDVAEDIESLRRKPEFQPNEIQSYSKTVEETLNESKNFSENHRNTNWLAQLVHKLLPSKKENKHILSKFDSTLSFKECTLMHIAAQQIQLMQTIREMYEQLEHTSKREFQKAEFKLAELGSFVQRQIAKDLNILQANLKQIGKIFSEAPPKEWETLGIEKKRKFLSNYQKSPQKALIALLQEYGIQTFESMGQKFDPKRHNVLEERLSANIKEGMVVEEFEKGFLKNGQLFRPATVALSRSPKSEGERNA